MDDLRVDIPGLDRDPHHAGRYHLPGFAAHVTLWADGCDWMIVMMRTPKARRGECIRRMFAAILAAAEAQGCELVRRPARVRLFDL